MLVTVWFCLLMILWVCEFIGSLFYGLNFRMMEHVFNCSFLFSSCFLILGFVG